MLANCESRIAISGGLMEVRDQDERQRASDEQRKRDWDGWGDQSASQQKIELDDVGGGHRQKRGHTNDCQHTAPNGARGADGESDETKRGQQEKNISDGLRKDA